jgi:hypothetical protein
MTAPKEKISRLQLKYFFTLAIVVVQKIIMTTSINEILNQGLSSYHLFPSVKF